MNAVMPEGIRVIEAYEPQRKVSELKWLDVKGIFEYDERDKAAMAAALEEFFARVAIVITKKTKRGMGESDIRPAIQDHRLHGRGRRRRSWRRRYPRRSRR